jgi:hypothetical protein
MQSSAWNILLNPFHTVKHYLGFKLSSAARFPMNFPVLLIQQYLDI